MRRVNTNLLLVWLGLLVMLLLVSHHFSNQTFSGRNAGAFMVLAVGWFGWLVLTYAVRQKLFGVEGDEPIQAKAPEVVEQQPDGRWALVGEEADESGESDVADETDESTGVVQERWNIRDELEPVPESENPSAWKEDLVKELLEHHRTCAGVESDAEWEAQKSRMVVAFEEQTVRELKRQMISLLGEKALKYSTGLKDSDGGFAAARTIAAELGPAFEAKAQYWYPRRFTVYQVGDLPSFIG